MYFNRKEKNNPEKYTLFELLLNGIFLTDDVTITSQFFAMTTNV